jgi:stringent starvation protein B
LTPYLSVKVDAQTRVPVEYVKNGEIVLNISNDATYRLTIGDDCIQFTARFNGVSRECSIPVVAIAGIFARENGQGLFFPTGDTTPQSDAAQAVPELGANTPNGGKPRLQVVK